MLLVCVYQIYIDELKQYYNLCYGCGLVGGNYYVGMLLIFVNVLFGVQIMVILDGCKVYILLVEGVSLVFGIDYFGFIVVIGLVGKLFMVVIFGGVLFNQKLNLVMLENEFDKQKLMILLCIFFEVYKGWYIQYNIVFCEMLLDVKKYFDQYCDLVVCVVGYFVFFIVFFLDVQDDIIVCIEYML